MSNKGSIKIPIRKCVGCHARKPNLELLKVLRTPKKENSGKIIVVLNQAKHSDGRGAYLCKNIECLKIAKKKRALERAFKRKIENTIYEILERSILNE